MNKNLTIPNNPEAEASVIAGILQDNRALYTAQEFLTPEDFYVKKNGLIFQCMIELDDQGDVIDILSLSDKLKKKGLFEKIGGTDYFAYLMSEVPLMSNYTHHCRIVKDTAKRRGLMQIAKIIYENCYKDYPQEEDLFDEAERLIFELTQEKTEADFSSPQEIFIGSVQKIQETIDLRGKLPGITSGFKELDEEYTLGFQPDNLIILGGRPSMGKTALILNFLEHILLETGATVAFFSLEMSEGEVSNRLIAAHSGLNLTQTLKGNVDEKDFGFYNDSASRFYNSRLFIDDRGSTTIRDIRRKCRRLKGEKGLDMVIIDHLQLLRTGKKADNPYFEIRELSRDLKTLAKELNVPVICLSQLNRAVEGRNDHKPTLADLKECGSIEQDADVVMLLHRESYYKDTPDNKAELIVAKNRNGKTGTVPLIWHPEITRFTCG